MREHARTYIVHTYWNIFQKFNFRQVMVCHVIKRDARTMPHGLHRIVGVVHLDQVLIGLLATVASSIRACRPAPRANLIEFILQSAYPREGL